MAQSLKDINYEIINSLGFDEGFRLPIANVKNKKLEQKFLELQKLKASLQAHFNEENDRVKDIENHLKNVKKEITIMQMLLLAKKKEADGEDNLTTLKVRECQKMEKNILEVEKQFHDFKEKENTCENEIFKLNQKIEEIKKQIDWDQQSLENWVEECSTRDGNIDFLEKYSRQDEVKVKEISMKISNLSEELLMFKKKCEQEAVETQAAQFGVDKIADEYRSSHEERKSLIDRWQLALKHLHTKDLQMDELALKITETRRKMKMKEVDIKYTEEFLDSEKKVNEEAEVQLKFMENMQMRRRSFLVELVEMKMNVTGELMGIKQELERAANDLESSRGQVKAIKEGVMLKKGKLMSMTKKLGDLQEQEKFHSKGVVGAETRTREMERMMEEEERIQRRLEEELRTLNFQLYKKQQAVQELTNKKNNLEGDIQSAKAGIKNLTLKHEKLDEEGAKQTKILYNQDYRLQELNKELSKLQGIVAFEDEDVYEEKINNLNSQLDIKRKALQFATNQHHCLSEDMKRLKQECDNLKDSRTDLSKQSQELQLRIEVTGKVLKELIGQKQDKMVYENLMKLELKRLRNILFRRANDNMSVEKDLVLMKSAMEERSQEVKGHRALLLTETKMLEEELRKNNIELQEKMTKIDQLKKRYDIVIMKMSPLDGEDSVVGYLIKATQEMEELKIRGDGLNSEIISKQQELVAFDNTLALVAGRNEVQKNVLRGTHIQAPEHALMDEKLKALMHKLKFKKHHHQNSIQENQKLGSTLQDLTGDIFYSEEELTKKNQELSKLKKDLNDQQTKLERVTKMNLKLSKDLITKKINLTNEELDITIRELKEINNMVTREINNILCEHPNLQKHFDEANIQLSPVESPGQKKSPSLMSLRSSQGQPQKSVSSGVSSPKVNMVSITIKDVMPPLQDKPPSRPTSKSSRHSSSGRMSIKK